MGWAPFIRNSTRSSPSLPVGDPFGNGLCGETPTAADGTGNINSKFCINITVNKTVDGASCWIRIMLQLLVMGQSDGTTWLFQLGRKYTNYFLIYLVHSKFAEVWFIDPSWLETANWNWWRLSTLSWLYFSAYIYRFLVDKKKSISF